MGSRGRFVERTVGGLLDAFERSDTAETLARSGGLLQRLDPRAKVVGLFALILATALVRRLDAIAIAFAIALLLAALSRLSLATLAKRAWLPVVLFTLPIALPALVTTPGRPLVESPIPEITITEQGARSVAILCGRAATAATLTLLLVLTTPWPHVLKALTSVGVPSIAVAVLGMTHRYLYALVQSAVDMFEARRSRTIGILDPSERRLVTASVAATLLTRSVRLSDEIYFAMRSRGYRGTIRLMGDFRFTPLDGLVLVLMLASAATLTVFGWNS